MAYDWLDLSRRDEIEFVMVSAQSLDQPLGVLTGVDLSSSDITSAYYTDSRTVATLQFLDAEQYIPNSRIRIIHRIPEWGYENELGTYWVGDNPMSRKYNSWHANFTLNSMLEGLASDLAVAPWTVNVGASFKEAFMQMLTQRSVEYNLNAAKDGHSGSVYVYDTGSSYLSRLYDLCAISGNRLDVDGHGVVTVEPYISPRSKAPKFRLDLADLRGIVEDDISLTTTALTIPNRCIVTYYYDDEWNRDIRHEITAYADATGNNSIKTKGYVVADFYEVTELNPPTYEQALSIAQSRLEQAQTEKVEWELTTAYFPVWEGDTVELVVHDGPAEYQGVRHCLVKSQRINLSTMTMELTLKETASGDEE